ncbi:MAG: dienelactone hydrolase family protein [Chthoniobacterales bacterium]|nr:dienelactone hydrolase family protein [Chthoniobacterales bacterium]
MRALFGTIAVAAVLAAAPTVQAQDWAKARLEKSPRHGEWVELKHGERTLKAFVVFPERKEKVPVVIVIHEIFGLTDWVRGVCDQLAEAGYIAIAPDLLSKPGGGTETYESVDEARKAIAELSSEQVIADLHAASEHALKLPASNGTLAVSGFCWGGSWTIGYASKNPKLKAAYAFYGSSNLKDESYATIACPIYGFYGEDDARVNESLPETEEKMKAAGKKFEPVIYKGAGHGFMRQGEAPDAKPENKQARDDAWERWKKLLKEL